MNALIRTLWKPIVAQIEGAGERRVLSVELVEVAKKKGESEASIKAITIEPEMLRL